MIVLRGLVVSLGVFAIAYLGASLAVAALCRILTLERLRPLLYAFRTAPLWIATLLVGGFTIPAFLSLEPRTDHEFIGWFAWMAAAFGTAMLASGSVRSLRACLATWRFQRGLLRNGRQERIIAGQRVHEFPDPGALMLVTGLWRPAVLISTAALELLDEGELEAAVRHELAHADHVDNLKKLVLRFCAFPFFRALDARWLEEAEMAADDSAARDQSTALDLASALLKMARHRSSIGLPELSLTLVSGPGVALDARVNRLLSAPFPRARTHRPVWLAVLPLAVLLLAHYGWLLARAHQLSELLIR